MTATILDGRAVARALRDELRAEVTSYTAEAGAPPRLGVLLMEGDPAAERYIRRIRKGCDEVGIAFVERRLSAGVDQGTLETAMRDLSGDDSVHGVLLQLPLPRGLDAAGVIARLDPRKDVDGVHPTNAGLLAQGQTTFVPNTPAGGMALLRHYQIPLAGRRAAVVGRSMVVGRPMALLLLHEHATVTICHTRTPDLAAVLREAEIVVAAAGRPGLITGAMLRPGAVVVDFGINVLADGAVVGDVDFASAAEVAGAITPVPGGTGPVTNVMLLRNVIQAARGSSAGSRHAPGRSGI